MDIYRIIRAHRIMIRNIRADPDDFNGLYMRVRGQPIILLNMLHPPTRRRFTAAHEFYHYLASAEHPGVPRVRLHAGSQPETVTEIREERYANRFAAALLMPDTYVRELAQKGAAAEEIAARCRVSMDTAVVRLKELRLSRVALLAGSDFSAGDQRQHR